MDKKKYNIMHIDDNLQLMEFIDEIIDEINQDNVGIEIAYTMFTKPDDLCNQLTHEIPDLIISDLMLETGEEFEDPTESGVNLIKTIKKQDHYKDIKILVYSARGDDFLKNELTPYIVGYCTKRIADSEFKQQIINCLTGVNNEK